MTAPFQYHNEYIKIPSPNSHLVLMLHGHMQVFTSSVGTQTDPEIFYVNGKPARAVQPFRVIPKPKSVQTVPVQTEVDEQDEDTNTEEQPHTEEQPQTEEQPHTSGWQQEQWASATQEVGQEIEIQSEQLEIEEQEQEDVQEEEVQEYESPEPEMQEPVHQELQSQETQTELQHLQRQLLLLKEEEQAAAEAK